MFYFKENEELKGMMTTHVDDFLNGGCGMFRERVLTKINEKFDIGTECEYDFKYVGINVKQQKNYISIDQNHYINAIEEVSIGNNRVDDALSEKEQKLFRGLVGYLNWISLISRPDVSFEVVDLSTRFQAPTYGDILLANKAVRKVKNTPFELRFHALKMDERLKIVSYSDGSFKNLCDGVASGSGRIIFLVDGNNRCCPLTWNSNKLKKIVDSTLAAESMSLSAAIKEAVYIKCILKELIGENYQIPIFCVIDSRGTRDAVYSTKLVEDRGTRLFIADIKQCLESNTIEKVIHVKGTSMLADCLTKRGASSKMLLDVLEHGVLSNLELKI